MEKQQQSQNRHIIRRIQILKAKNVKISRKLSQTNFAPTALRKAKCSVERLISKLEAEFPIEAEASCHFKLQGFNH